MDFVGMLQRDGLQYNTLFFNCRHLTRAISSYPMTEIPGFTFDPVPSLIPYIQNPGPRRMLEYKGAQGNYMIFVDRNTGEEFPIYNDRQGNPF